MLVFMDESGDPGFRLGKGSSPVFAVAMVIFTGADAAQATAERVASLQRELGVKPEFKFSKASDDIRDKFFRGIVGCPFIVRAIAVKKRTIRSDNLKEHKDRFYNYFVKQMMKYDGGILSRASVRIDGSGERVFRRELRVHLSRALGDRIKDVRFSDSRSDPLIQLADMCAGAIARSRREDRPDAARWLRQLQPRVEDIWDFR